MSKRAIALVGSALMVASVAGTATVAVAAPGDRDRDRNGCSVELDQRGRGNVLTVEVDGPRRADRAAVRLDFERRGDRNDTTVRRVVDLDRRGEGTVRVQIPNRADSVDATVRISDGRRGFITCRADLDLNRRGGGRN